MVRGMTAVRLVLGCLLLAAAGCSSSAPADPPVSEPAESGSKPAGVGLLEGLAALAGSPVSRCDSLAADGDDPDARGEGVDLETMDAEDALAACDRAVKIAPGDPVTLLQRARARLANGDAEGALVDLDASKAAGGCAANYYLGVHAQDPWTEGTAIDLLRARDFFRAAIDCFYEPANDALARISFVRLGIINDLLDGGPEAMARLDFLKPATASVLIGMTKAFGEPWPPGMDNTCGTTSLYRPGELDRDLAAAQGGNARHIGERVLIDLFAKLIGLIEPTWTNSWEKIKEILAEQGRVDGLRIIQNFGCESEFSLRIADSISQFSKTPRSIVDIVKELADDPEARKGLNLFRDRVDSDRPPQPLTTRQSMPSAHVDGLQP